MERFENDVFFFLNLIHSGLRFASSRQAVDPNPSWSRGQKGSGRGNYALSFRDLLALSQDDAQPSEVIRKLGDAQHGLAALLDSAHGRPELIELVLVIMGQFCEKNGQVQFTEGFVAIVQTLAEKNVFKQTLSVVMQIPGSFSENLPSQTDRLTRLIKSVYRLACEILVLMPAYGCTYLGEHFFVNLLTLKGMTSIQLLKVPDHIFELLHQANLRLQVHFMIHDQIHVTQPRMG